MKFQCYLVILFTSLNLIAFSQDNFQTFPAAGFKVKCGCKLYINTTFIQMAKQQGSNNIIAAYVCAENQNNANNGVIININIYDESKNYTNIQPSRYAQLEEKYLEQYAGGLSKAGFTYNYLTYLGVSAIEYKFDQQGVPTKAIMFIKNKKSYFLQTATHTNLMAKFSELKNSFKIL